jgi:hypothetical protein
LLFGEVSEYFTVILLFTRRCISHQNLHWELQNLSGKEIWNLSHAPLSAAPFLFPWVEFQLVPLSPFLYRISVLGSGSSRVDTGQIQSLYFAHRKYLLFAVLFLNEFCDVWWDILLMIIKKERTLELEPKLLARRLHNLIP